MVGPYDITMSHLGTFDQNSNFILDSMIFKRELRFPLGAIYVHVPNYHESNADTICYDYDCLARSLDFNTG